VTEYEGKWGFIDKTGREVVPFKYDAVRHVQEGMVAVGIGDWRRMRWGFISIADMN